MAYNQVSGQQLSLSVTTTPSGMSRVDVPADFGVENLDSAVHGNITLLLSDGLHRRANSIILALNSPVFRRIFIEQEKSTVDFKMFEAASVRLFIRCLYSGKCQFSHVSVDEVREVREVSEAMEVVWLREKCERYLAEHEISITPSVPVIERPSSRPNFRSDSRASRGKSNKNELTSEAHITKLNFDRSMTDLQMDVSEMDLKLFHTPSSEEIPTTSDETRTTCSDESFKSREKFRTETSQTPEYKRIRRTVSCSSEVDSEGESRGRHSKRYRQSDSDNRSSGSSSRRSLHKQIDRGPALKSQITTPTKQKKSSSKKLVFRDCNPELPNMFHSYRDTLGHLTRSKTDLPSVLEVLKSCREIRSLYMLFEALELVEYNNTDISVTESDLGMISELRKRRGWGRVSPHFLENCSFFNRHFVESETLASERKELTSRSESVKVPDSLPPYSIRLEDMLRSVRVIEFQFKHPDIETCSKRGKCGFLLQLTGETQRNRATQRDRSTLLHIRLLRSSRFYTNSKVHYHDEVMSPDKMHLVVEEHFMTRSTTGGNSRTNYVSWRGRPFLERHGKSEMVSWGELQIPAQRHVRLVVYYDVGVEERGRERRGKGI